MSLKNKVVVITGGGSGIGRASALAFAKQGASVVVLGRRPQPLLETVKMIQQKGGQGLYFSADVRNWTQVKGAMDSVVGQLGKIDILLNNAAIAFSSHLVETSEAQWDEIMDTNLKGIFLCCKAVIPVMMHAKKGVIINVSSELGKSGHAYWTVYSASKFGVIGFTQALAEENKSFGIYVYAICPGRTATEMQQRCGGEMLAKLSMPPEKVAKKIIDLAEGKIRLASGQDIVIDEQSLRLRLYEARIRCHSLIRHWKGYTYSILQGLKRK